jgi:hypothetical protein
MRAIERMIGGQEACRMAQMRFAIEASLPLKELIGRVSPRISPQPRTTRTNCPIDRW